MANGPPAHWGAQLTQTIHSKPEGPTDPKNISLPSNFVACVTGAGKGLGYHIALAYAQAGAMGIVVSSRTKTDLDKLAKEIAETAPKVEVVVQPCDAQSETDAEQLASVTWEKFGRVDAVVANAGVISGYVTREDGKEYLPVGMTEDPDFERVIVAKHFTPLLARTKDGVQAFVAITSIAAHMKDSAVTPFAYNLSKIGQVRMVEHIASDHGAEGVQAFAVHPGAVLTPQTEKHHTTQLGDFWTQGLKDDVSLCGGFLTWLTAERRDWLNGRYLSATWDVEELEAMKEDIVGRDKLKFEMVV